VWIRIWSGYLGVIYNFYFSFGFWAVFQELKASSWSLEGLRNSFGPSTVLATSAQTIMTDTNQYVICSSRSLAIDEAEALNVCSCRYESNSGIQPLALLRTSRSSNPWLCLEPVAFIDITLPLKHIYMAQ